MTSRIGNIFSGLRSSGRTGLVTYVTAGDPDLERSAAILRGLDRAGADVLEVGVPFSDPLADGPVIQRASERALAAGGTLTTTLDLIRDVRQDVQAAIVVFTYANPVLRMGLHTFARRAAAVGVDGVLVLDLPLEEAEPFRQAIMEFGLDPIFLLSPHDNRGPPAPGGRSGPRVSVRHLAARRDRRAGRGRRRRSRTGHAHPRRVLAAHRDRLRTVPPGTRA